jgi:hypothetical protein
VAEDPPPDPTDATSDTDLLAAARWMVNRSLEQALAWAQRRHGTALGERLRFAVLRAWGERDPRAAVAWALAQEQGARQLDMEAALTGAARQPDVALAIGRQLLVGDTAAASGYVTALIGALGAAGQFWPALTLAIEGPAAARDDWTTATLRRWAEVQPEGAITALEALAGEPAREPGFRAVVDGWAATNPSTLAAFAAQLPPGSERGYALGQAIDRWSQQDAAAMSAWVAHLPPSAERDRGALAMVIQADGANRDARSAVAWAESIGDSVLRLAALAAAVREWAAGDPVATRGYVTSASSLSAEEREWLLSQLES